ncbi:apoptotic chromatin condensation inducer in the nucleus-like isoform X2 [Orbicella faveolata]|uniref:apoptotic chromatin condensation inducer in the nucleus-like isoform X2 n=1 Tax=Orbicella faveolata TaxID=48498 RepID=UPI0009E65C9E|nr:apoptotic chromatin condensation inducer in the nucleus-like isoform X2 [Orbicella faveolata]
MAEREITIGGRRLSQLKVDELKVELEKRGLKKSGNKGILIERLQEAIDKELELKEGFENYTAPQQRPAPVAKPWSHPMIQQQQQQPGGFPVQPMGMQQGMLNQPHVMMNQQQLMMNQQQITSPMQVNEFREQWPQAQIPQSQIPQAQMPQHRMAQPQMLYQQPQENQQVINQIASIPGSQPLTHSSNHQVLQPTVEPEVESSSSSDNEQDSAQQSSSSSSQDSDEQERPTPTSLLNYNYPAESRPETKVPLVGIEKRESRTVEDDGVGAREVTPKEMEEGEGYEEEEDEGGKDKEEKEEEKIKKKVEEEGEEKLNTRDTDKEVRSPFEQEEEGDRRVEIQETLSEKKEKEAEEEEEPEKLSQSPVEEMSLAPHPEQQPSPAEENTFEVEPSEEDKAVVEEPKVPSPLKSASPVVTKKRKISLPRTSLPSTPTEGQPASRKRRWGSSSSKKKTSLSISTDSLKDLIPGVQVQSTPALEAVMDIGNDDNEEEEEEPEEKKADQKLDPEKEEAPTVTTPEVKEEGKRRKDRIVKVEEKKTIKLQRKPVVMESEQETAKMEVEEDPLEQRLEGNPHPRRTSLPVQEASSPAPAAEHSPSRAKNPQSEVLHVKNLVRPFTLNQLKDLLGKHGTLVEGGFWIDKIKSHCYVVYSDVEEAAACRRALHGIKWPVTSPKILDVDFADQDEMARDTDGVLGTKKEKEREIKAEKVPKREQPEEKPKEVEEEEEDDQKNPGNLLDNLFRKTKTTPCLYWLPLTDEQIATREQEREERRKARQEERDKEDEERKERQQQREKEREMEREKEKGERETEKPRSRSPRNRRRERSRSRSRGPRRR